MIEERTACCSSPCRYRYQLEAFVDKVRGRTPQYWTPQQDPINQMKTIDAVYEKASAMLLSCLRGR